MNVVVSVWPIATGGPHGVEQHRAGEDLPGALQQGGEQRELLGRQVHGISPVAYDVAHGVERHVAGPEKGALILLAPRAPGEGPDAGQQLVCCRLAGYWPSRS